MTTAHPPPEDLAQRYSEVLLARAAPLFEQAALIAQDSGLHPEVYTSGSPPELCLQVRSSEQGYASYYLIKLDSGTRQVHHHLYFAINGTTRRLLGGLDSINSMVLDTHLAQLFREGFSVTLAPLEQRHPAGFW